MEQPLGLFLKCYLYMHSWIVMVVRKGSLQLIACL